MSFQCDGELVINTPDYGCILAKYKTFVGAHDAELTSFWNRQEFGYLGLIHFENGRSEPWAWHSDGRSIDQMDSGFDLVGFPRRYEAAEPEYFHWLGKEAA